MQRKILKTDLKFCSLGLASVRQISLYVTVASACWYFILFLYLQYLGNPKMLKSSQMYRGVTMICGLSLLIKLTFIVESFIEFKLLPVWLSYVILIGCQEVLYFLDLFTAIYLQDTLFNHIQGGVFAAVSLVNLFVTILMKIVGQIIKCNYSLVHPNPFKKIPEFGFYLFRQVLRTSWFILLFVNLSSNAFIVQPILIILYVAIEIKYDYTTLPNSYDIIGYLQILKLSVLFSICVSVFLSRAFPIMNDNSQLLFILLCVFLGCSSIAVRKAIQTKYLQCNLEQLDGWRQTYIKLSRFAELLKDTSESARTQVQLSFGFHQIACTDPSCVCKMKNHRESFRNSTKTMDNNQANLEVFFLNRAQFNRSIYSELICPQLLVMSALSWMHFYPRLFYEARVCIESFPKSMSLSNSNLLNFMIAQDLALISENNKKKGTLLIEAIQLYEQRFNKLKLLINEACRNKINIWNSLANKVSEPDEFAKLLENELKSRNNIMSSYKQVLKISNSEELWRTMTAYARFIVKDRKIQAQIIKHNKKSINFSSFFTVNRNHMSYLVEHESTCLIKVSMQKHTLGNIMWFSKNSAKIFQFTQKESKIGFPIESLMPKIYQQKHRRRILEWFEMPLETNINNFISIFISTAEVQFVKAQLYIKVLPGLGTYDLLVMITKIDDSQFLVIDSLGATVSIPKFIKQIMQNELVSYKSNLNISLMSNQVIQLLQTCQITNAQLRLSLYVPHCYINIQQEFYANIANLKSYHGNNIESSILHNLRRYFFSKVQVCSGSQYDMVMQPSKITIDSSSYLVLRLLKLDKVSKEQTLIKQFCRIATRNCSQGPSHRTASFQSKIQHRHINEIVQGSSYGSSADSNDVSHKKEMINGYSSRHLRNAVIYSGLCFLLMLVNSIAKQIMINKMVQSTSQSLSYGPTVNLLIQLSALTYDYAMLYGYRQQINLPQNHALYFQSKTQELAQSISLVLKGVNLNQQYQNQENLASNPLQTLLNTVAQMNTSNQVIQVKMNVFFSRWIQDCLTILQRTQTSQNKDLPKIMLQNFNEIEAVKEKLDAALKRQWETDFSNVQNTIIICYALNFICAAILMYSICKYVQFRINHKRQILDVYLKISYTKICAYLQESIFQNNHFDEILWQNDQKRKSIRPTPSGNVKVSFIAYKNWNYWWIFIGLFMVIIFPESVGTPQLCTSLENSLSLTNQANRIFEMQSETMAAITQSTNLDLGNTINGNPNLYSLEQRFSDINNLFLQVSKFMTEDQRDSIRSFHDSAVTLLTQNVCEIGLTPPDKVVCQSVPFLTTGVLPTYSFLIREFQQMNKYMIKTNTIIGPKSIGNPVATLAYLSLYFTGKQLYRLSQQIIKSAQDSINDIHTIITVVTTITIVVVVAMFLIGTSLYRRQNKEYTMRCKYLLIIPDEEFRENLYLDITLNKLKQISFVKYG